MPFEARCEQISREAEMPKDTSPCGAFFNPDAGGQAITDAVRMLNTCLHRILTSGQVVGRDEAYTHVRINLKECLRQFCSLDTRRPHYDAIGRFLRINGIIRCAEVDRGPSRASTWEIRSKPITSTEFIAGLEKLRKVLARSKQQERTRQQRKLASPDALKCEASNCAA